MAKFEISKILSLVDNDRLMAQTLMEMFLELTPQDFNNLKLQVENGDIEAAGKVAHKMKSSLATMGIIDISEIMKSIEYNAKGDKQIDFIRENMGIAEYELNSVYSSIHEILNEQKA